MDDSRIEKLLTDMLFEVQLLNVSIKADAQNKFNEEFLTSDLRAAMYHAFDGERTLQQISENINCKTNTLQVFAQNLADKDLVDLYFKGNSRVLNKSVLKIALYYANQTLTRGVI